MTLMDRSDLSGSDVDSIEVYNEVDDTTLVFESRPGRSADEMIDDWALRDAAADS